MIETIAGTGATGYGGDAGPAIEAQFDHPDEVAVDAAGNVYVADRGNHRIRRIGSDGTVETIAGTAVAGFGGDGGPAIEARLDTPFAVAVDAPGNVYVVDHGNHRIRRIGPDGMIETIAGTGVAGFGGDGGPAVEALLTLPEGIAVDGPGNVYVADTADHRIRRIGPDGTIETIAGTGQQGFGGDGGPAIEAQLHWPDGVAVDASGNVFLADKGNHRIRRIGPDGTIETISGTGERGYGGDGDSAFEAQLNWPADVAVDASSGSVYVADTFNHRVRVLKPAEPDDHSDEADCATPLTLGVPVSGRIETGGDADWFRLELAAPTSVGFYTWGDLDTVGLLRGEGTDTENDDGGNGSNFYIQGTWPAGVYFVRVESFETDTGEYTLIARRFADVALGETGETVRLWASGDGTSAGDWTLAGTPFASGGQVTDSDGEPYVLRFGPGGAWTATPAAGGCAADAGWTMDTLAGTGVRGFGGDGGPAAGAQLNWPYGVAVDASGNAYIADHSNHRIRRIGPDGTIETIAGTGARGNGGDGGPALEAQLNSPDGVAVDLAGNLYVVDWPNHRIRRIDPDGTIRTIAGTGEAGYAGDAGPAVEARLNFPSGVAVDASGAVYVTEHNNHRIRRIGPDGTIETIAGTGVQGYGGDGGPATEAQLDYPSGVAVDASGNVYVADTQNHRIRRIDPEGTIETIAGTGAAEDGGDGGPATGAQLYRPYGVAVDASGNVYVADTQNHRIRRIDPEGTIETIAGTGAAGNGGDGGPATGAQLNQPHGLAVGASGVVYVSDSNNHRVRVLKPVDSDDHGDATDCATPLTLGVPVSGRIETGDDADWFSLELAAPASVAFYTAGDLDTVGHLRGEGTETENDDGGSGSNFYIGGEWPAGVYFLRVESFAGNTGSYALIARRFADVTLGETGETVRLWATGDGTLADGWTLDGAPFANGGQVTASNGVAYVLRFGPGAAWTAAPLAGVCAGWTIDTLAGTEVEGFGGDGGAATEALLNNPFGVAVDSRGNVYVADRYNHRIRRIGPDGTIETIAGIGVAGYGGDGGPATEALLNHPKGLAVSAAGHVYVADGGNSRIRRIGPDGTIETIAGTGEYGQTGDGEPATHARLSAPIDVSVDAAGSVYVADSGAHVIRRIGPDGTIETIAGTGRRSYGGDGGPAVNAQFTLPYGLAVDASGNVYVADSHNHRIRRIRPDGTIETIAGTGVAGYGGDGGPAVEARLDHPYGVSVDASGNVYVADFGNSRVRRIGPEGIIETIAGTGERRYGGDDGPASLAGLPLPLYVAVDTVTGRVYVKSLHRVRVLEPRKPDDHANDADCATPLTLGVPVSGRIETGGDADWFRLQLAAPASVAFYTAGELDTVGLLRAGGLGTETENDDGGEGSNFYIQGAWPADVYYVRVESSGSDTGDYALTARRFADVTLGETGETVRLWASGDGTTADGWTLYGETLASGRQITALNGEAYVLRFGPGGSWTASPAAGVCVAGAHWTIGTLAGTGVDGHGGDGGMANEALLNNPFDVALDASGNVYVADRVNHRIRRVGTDGLIATLAGTGEAGYSGDGGPATSARLNYPIGVAVDAVGHVYVADRSNDRIRRIGLDGTIATIAGTGERGYGGDGGAATEARLDRPAGVAVDLAGNVYVADTGNERIRRIRPDGTIETIAGTGEAGYVGDGGPATQARFDFPFRVAVDTSGNVYVADSGNHRIRRIRPDGTIETIAGTGVEGHGGDGGPAVEALLAEPAGVAVDVAGYVYVADFGNSRIRWIGPEGTIETFAGTGEIGYGGDGGPAAEARLGQPAGVAVDHATGNVYVADTLNHRVRAINRLRACDLVAGGTEPSSGGGMGSTSPSFAAGAGPGDRTYTVGTAIDTLTLPSASGGDGTLTYSLSPDVPGLVFNAATRQLAGTPRTADTYSMTYTVTDEDGDTDTLGFTITVSGGTAEPGPLGVCRVGMLVRVGQSCTYPGTGDAFSVNARGRGSFLDHLAGIRIRINNETIGGRVYDFLASHRGDGIWRIDRIAGSTEPPTGGDGNGEDETGIATDITLVDASCSSAPPSTGASVVQVTIAGSVRANKSVTEITVTGYANGAWVGSDSLGSLAEGDSGEFSISGSISRPGATLSCRVSIEYRIAGDGGGNNPVRLDLVVSRHYVE